MAAIPSPRSPANCIATVNGRWVYNFLKVLMAPTPGISIQLEGHLRPEPTMVPVIHQPILTPRPTGPLINGPVIKSAIKPKDSFLSSQLVGRIHQKPSHYWPLYSTDTSRGTRAILTKSGTVTWLSML